MARVIVLSDDRQHILMDELVMPVHLSTEFSSLQVIERMAEAVRLADEEHRAPSHLRATG